MRKTMKKRVAAVVLSCAVAVSSMWGMPLIADAHGTTDVTITKDMLKTEDSIPSDYVLNQDTQGEAKNGTYDKYFLKEDVQEVRIKVDENNLNYLLQNAGDKPTVMTDSVTIGDQTVKYTGLKTKGNYTLNATNGDENSDRFSFTVNFGKYIKKKKYSAKQNFFGCNKISFNNFYFDRSMMVEYFAMRLMTEMGIPTPQYGLAKLYINNQYYGVYFMVEAMDSSIIEQYQKIDSGDVSDYLVKPSDGTAGSSAGSKLQYSSALDSLIQTDGTFDLSSVLSKNANKEYEASGALLEQQALWEADDDTLQDVAKTLPTVLSWEKKLNQLSSGKNFAGKSISVNSDEYISLLNEIVDSDELVKYFAVHSFLVQLDDMFENYQNFGLYVDDQGKALVIPWDYDLSFGRFHPGTAEETANFDIDRMYWSDRNYADFPLFHVISQNTTLMKKYYQYMKDCSKIAALGGTTSFGKTYEAAYFNSYIDKMSDKLLAAIKADKLASNVTYLNGQTQPSNCIQALPNLSKIIAMRSAGVAAQVEGINTTVSGKGCSLGSIGNADNNGFTSSNGDITNIDETTGITIRSTYGNGNNQGGWGRPGQGWGTSPNLSLAGLDESSSSYKEILATLNTSSSNVMIYRMSNDATPKTDYTLTIPIGSAYKGKTVNFYSFASSDADAVKLTASQIGDGRYTMTTTSIAYIAVVTGNTETVKKTEDNKNTTTVDNKQNGTTSASEEEEESVITKGSSYTANAIRYKVTKGGENPTVTITAVKKKNVTSISIGSMVTLNGKKCKVTAIANNAFKNCKKLKKVTIGANITKIGSKAFYGCKNLKTITIKTTKLTTSKVGSQAFKGIAKKASIKVPKKKVKAYKKMLLKKGVGKKAKIKA